MREDLKEVYERWCKAKAKADMIAHDLWGRCVTAFPERSRVTFGERTRPAMLVGWHVRNGEVKAQLLYDGAAEVVEYDWIDLHYDGMRLA